MTAAKAFCILSALLGGGSIYYTKRNDLASTRLLFLAYSMLLISVLAELRRWGVL